MHALITGGAGFIGSHLSDALIERGDDVTVIDDLSNGRRDRLDKRVALYRSCITDARAVSAIVKDSRPDIIFHLAAQIDVRASMTRPAQDALVNIYGTINILDAARSNGARVLLASTGGAIYGPNSSVPAMEDIAPEPKAPYGASKYCAEQYIALYNQMHHCRHAVLRLANVYGPRQEPTGEAGVIAIFCHCAVNGSTLTVYGDGTQTRDYIYVSDAVRAFIAAADTDIPGTWNIGTGIETNITELIDLIGKYAGRDLQQRFVDARPGEVQRSAIDSSRAREDLGWQACTSLATGIERVYGWISAGRPDRSPS